MLCSTCHGQHVILVQGRPYPCPECSGLGTLHCCDGLQAQPEDSESGAACENMEKPCPPSDHSAA